MSSINGSGEYFYELAVVARESITVPVGTFTAFRVEGRGYNNLPRFNGPMELRYWIGPDKVRQPLALEDIRRAGAITVFANRIELVAFTQS